MKIAFVLHQFLPRYNAGTEQYVYHLAKEFLNRGDEVNVFCFEPNFERNRPFANLRHDRFENIPVTRVSGWMGLFPNYVLAQYYNPFFGKLFADFLREEQIELVHFFQNSYFGVSLVDEAYLAGIPQVVNLMDFWYLCPHVQLLRTTGELCDGPWDYRSCIDCLAPLDDNYKALAPFVHGEEAVPLIPKVYEGANSDFLAGSDPYHRVAAMAVRPHLIRRTLSLVDAIVSPSQFLKSVFVRNGYDPEKIMHVPYGIDLEALQGIERAPASHLRVGYIGTLSAHKGLDILVRAFLNTAGDDLSLEVHGDLGAFPEFSTHVQNLAREDGRIHFHGRFESSALPDVLRKLDVVVVPSIWYENTPFVILEALASGTPVIASDLGGLSELVEDGINGFLFEAGSAESLGEKILAFKTDRGLVERLRPDPSKARSLKDNVEEFSTLYEQLRSERGRQAPLRSEASNPAMESEMEADNERTVKSQELLDRHIHHLTGQLFHMINLNMGYTRRIKELERAMDDRAFLDGYLGDERGLNLPRDLSPSIQRKLIQLEQLKAILSRKNELVGELDRRLHLYREGAARQEDTLREQNNLIEDQRQLVANKTALIQELQEHNDKLQEHNVMLTDVVERLWNNPIYKILVKVKRFLGMGRKKD
jgi:glycosyltransferase involved in cell wall biosynthesis